VTKRLDHIAIAVRDLDEAVRTYTETLGLRLNARETVEHMGVEAAFLECGGLLLEILAPLADDSPVGRFLEKRGPGVHHIAFEVERLDELLEKLKRKGAPLVDDTPRTGAGGKRVAFLHPKGFHGVLIELCESS